MARLEAALGVRLLQRSTRRLSLTEVGEAYFEHCDRIAEELALPPVKIHCSILAEDAIKAAVNDYKIKHGAAAASNA